MYSLIEHNVNVLIGRALINNNISSNYVVIVLISSARAASGAAVPLPTLHGSPETQRSKHCDLYLKSVGNSFCDLIISSSRSHLLHLRSPSSCALAKCNGPNPSWSYYYPYDLVRGPLSTRLIGIQRELSQCSLPFTRLNQRRYLFETIAQDITSKSLRKSSGDTTSSKCSLNGGFASLRSPRWLRSYYTCTTRYFPHSAIIWYILQC
jgi:hypothetical protein